MEESYLFDSADKDQERIDLARNELIWLLEQTEMHDMPLRVFANKQDLEKVKIVDEVTQELNLSEIKGRQGHTTGTSSQDTKNIDVGLEWLEKMRVK